MTEDVDLPKATMSAIVDQKIEVMRLVEDLEGEMHPLMEAYLQEVEETLATKADKYAIQEAEFYSQAAYFKELAKAFATRAKVVEQAADSLRERIKLTMQKLGTSEVNGNLYSYKLVRSKPKLVINENELPDGLKMHVVPASYYAPDKERVRATLEAGFEVQGAKLEEVFYPKSGLTKKPKAARKVEVK